MPKTKVLAEDQPSPWGRRGRKRDPMFSAKREALIAAAAALFREQGYERTSLSDLAARLKITKPTVYYYVASKDDLLLEVKRAAQEIALRFMKEAAAGPGTGYEKLRAIMVQYALLMTSDYGICLSQVDKRAMDPASRKTVYVGIDEANQIIYGILEEGQRDETLKVVDPVVVCHTLFGSLNWIGNWYRPDGRYPSTILAEMQADILLQGVRVDPAR